MRIHLEIIPPFLNRLKTAAPLIHDMTVYKNELEKKWHKIFFTFSIPHLEGNHRMNPVGFTDLMKDQRPLIHHRAADYTQHQTHEKALLLKNKGFQEVLVVFGQGNPRSSPGLTSAQAMEIFLSYGLIPFGVVHTASHTPQDEHKRLKDKIAAGVKNFILQSSFDTEKTLNFLKPYTDHPEKLRFFLTIPLIYYKKDLPFYERVAEHSAPVFLKEQEDPLFFQNYVRFMACFREQCQTILSHCFGGLYLFSKDLFYEQEEKSRLAIRQWL